MSAAIYSWLYILNIKIETTARNMNERRFTRFLFFLVFIEDCNLKEINKVMPAKKIKPKPKIKIFCGSIDPDLLNEIL